MFCESQNYTCNKDHDGIGMTAVGINYRF